MLTIHKFTKTVFITVFFYAITLNIGCKSTGRAEDTYQKFSYSKYTVNYTIDCKSSVTKYHKDADIIFFPLLLLNSKGLIIDDYEQELCQRGEYLNISSKFDIDNSIKSADKIFRTNFTFENNSLYYKIPLNLKKSYFIRFYHNIADLGNGRNSLYLKCSIEFLDPSDGNTLPASVWIGEGYFGFNENIKRDTIMNVAIDRIFEHSFINYSNDGLLNLLDM